MNKQKMRIKRDVTAVILAGGKASRMQGQDKGLLLLQNTPLYQHVIARLHHQVDQIVISANRNQHFYQQAGFPVISDQLPDHQGPLSGMLTAMNTISTDWALFVPCDTPFIPVDLVEKLRAALDENDAVYAHDGVHAHPTHLLINTRHKTALNDYLASGQRKIIAFLDSINAQKAVFKFQQNAFANINTPEDLRYYEQHPQQ